MRLDCDRVAGQTEECTHRRGGEDCLYSLRNIGGEGCKIIPIRKQISRPICCLLLCFVILAGNGIFKSLSGGNFVLIKIRSSIIETLYSELKIDMVLNVFIWINLRTQIIMNFIIKLLSGLNINH